MAGGNYVGAVPFSVQLVDPSSLVFITTNTSIGAQAYGRSFVVTGTGGYTVTLHAIISGTPAGTFTIFNDSGSAITIAAIGSDIIRQAGVGSATITIPIGDECLFQNSGSSWLAINTGVKSSLVGGTNSQYTGSPLVPNVTAGDSSLKAANTNFVSNALSNSGFAPLTSPGFTGIPTAPTQPTSDNSTKIATTAFVKTIPGTAKAWALFNGLTGFVASSFNMNITFLGSAQYLVTMPVPPSGPSTSNFVPVLSCSYSTPGNAVAALQIDPRVAFTPTTFRIFSSAANSATQISETEQYNTVVVFA